jgi:Fic family protein
MAFIPRFAITNQITAGLTRIERARGFLEAAKLSADWLADMQTRALIREAHFTTHIEGTQLTLQQAERIFAGEPVPEARLDDRLEVLNYRNAFDLVAGHLGSGAPIAEQLIKDLHRQLVLGVRGNEAHPGEYRASQCYVVNSATRQITYTPPPPEKVPGLMEEFVAWLNESDDINPILAAGISQFQLVDIHPFCDGNGRTARLLSTLCLYRKGYDFKKLFTLSEYYDRNRPAYYAAIKSARQNGLELSPWLEYFVEGLAAQLQEIQASGELAIKKTGLIQRYGLSARQSAAIAQALAKGGLTIQEFQSLSPGISRRTLQRDLKELVQKGLLVQEGSTNRLFYRLSDSAS